jgi:hypothetical protein
VVDFKQRIFILIPEVERNILFTGEHEQECDPYTYIWRYPFPELAVQNPVIQEIFLPTHSPIYEKF